MSFREISTATFGGNVFWRLLEQTDLFIMQEHVMFWVWPYRYRILLRTNRREIANAGSRDEIAADWKYLEEHAVPEMMRMAMHPRDVGYKVGGHIEDIVNRLKDHLSKDLVEQIMKVFLAL